MFLWKCKAVWYGDHGGQFCGPPWSILRGQRRILSNNKLIPSNQQLPSTAWQLSLPCVSMDRASTPIMIGQYICNRVLCLSAQVNDSRKVWISLNFKHPSSLTAENQTHVHIKFATVNDLRNKVLEYWYKFSGHPVYFNLVLYLGIRSIGAGVAQSL
jgi:hypothetical protein